MTTKEILTQAVTAKNAINSADTETKNKALANMADALLAHTDAILEANILSMPPGFLPGTGICR